MSSCVLHEWKLFKFAVRRMWDKSIPNAYVKKSIDVLEGSVVLTRVYTGWSCWMQNEWLMVAKVHFIQLQGENAGVLQRNVIKPTTFIHFNIFPCRMVINETVGPCCECNSQLQYVLLGWAGGSQLLSFWNRMHSLKGTSLTIKELDTLLKR